MTTAPVARPLHLRLLFPHLLTLPKTDPRRNATPIITQSPAIDQELFMYMAFLMRDFIHPWYHLVSQDQDLTDAIVDILTGVVQNLEKRCCQQVDWTELLLVSIPKLLTLHWRDYRQAKVRLHMNHASGTSNLDQLFHGMQPHIALQVGEQEYRRQLTDAVLPFLLDKNDTKNDAFRLLLREIMASIVLSSLTESLTDPYVIHTIICKLLQSFDQELDALESSEKFAGTYFSALTHDDPTMDIPIPTPPKKETKTTSQLLQNEENIGLFSKLRQLQEQQKEERQQQGVGDPFDELTKPTTIPNSPSSLSSLSSLSSTSLTSPHQLFSFGYITLQVLLSPFRSLYFYLQAIFTHSQQRYHQVNKHQKKTRHVRLIEPITKFFRVAFLVDDRPVVQWGWQMIAMFLWPILRVFGGGLLIDKFLEQTILHVLSEPFLVFYLRLGRDLLWPNGTLIQRGPAVTPLQRDQMRIRAERLLVVALPQPIAKALFGTTDLNQLQSHLHDALAPLQHKYINKHLIYLLVDLVISKVFPELVDPPHHLSSDTVL